MKLLEEKRLEPSFQSRSTGYKVSEVFKGLKESLAEMGERMQTSASSALHRSYLCG